VFRSDIINGFPRYGVFAAMLAFVGLPIYIHAPKFFVDEYGVSLTAIGAVLLAVRLLDFVQDPLLGWYSDRLSGNRTMIALISSIVLGLGMFSLFFITPPVNALVWFAVCIVVIFTAFSLLTIMFYAQGVLKAEGIGSDNHTRLSIWRETGGLIGLCLACVLPFAFQVLTPDLGKPLALYSVVFVFFALWAAFTMRGEWGDKVVVSQSQGLGLLSEPKLRRLLLIAFLNAAPVAVTSSLFLFYVEGRLGAPDAAAPMLLLFFLSAALAAPFWGAVANRIGTKQTLMIGMILSVVTFGFAFGLGTGQVAAFGIVCVLSGAALGADMTLLPALFARQVAASGSKSGQAFGLWSFAVKATLAIAAITVLPTLDMAGFNVGGANDGSSLLVLSILYALVPCVLKTLALIILFFTQLDEV